MGDFELDTRIEGSDGRYRARISKDWEIWGPNGGYVATIALRAAGAEAQIKRPASFSGHFLSVARFDAVDLDVTVVRRGRRSESIRVSMHQEGRPIHEAIVRTAAEGPGLEHDVARAPEVPEPLEVESYSERYPDSEPPYAFWYNLEARPIYPPIHDEPRAWDPLFRQWYRYTPRATFDDPFVDAGRLLLLIDTMSWPAAVGPHVDPTYQAPNLDVTAWFHRFDPQSDWLLLETHAPLAEGGLMGTTSRVFSRDRRLLASGGAQLLCVPASR